MHVLFAPMSAPNLDVSPGLELFFCVELACTFSADVVWLWPIVLSADRTATAGATLQSLPHLSEGSPLLPDSYSLQGRSLTIEIQVHPKSTSFLLAPEALAALSCTAWLPPCPPPSTQLP